MRKLVNDTVQALLVAIDQSVYEIVDLPAKDAYDYAMALVALDQIVSMNEKVETYKDLASKLRGDAPSATASKVGSIIEKLGELKPKKPVGGN